MDTVTPQPFLWHLRTNRRRELAPQAQARLRTRIRRYLRGYVIDEPEFTMHWDPFTRTGFLSMEWDGAKIPVNRNVSSEYAQVFAEATP